MSKGRKWSRTKKSLSKLGRVGHRVLELPGQSLGTHRAGEPKGT